MLTQTEGNDKTEMMGDESITTNSIVGTENHSHTTESNPDPRLVEIMGAEGYEHLRAEGFTEAHIAQMVRDGVRWVEGKERADLGYPCGKGLHIPATNQLKLFPPLPDPETGKLSKYRWSKNPWVCDKEAVCEVETEGYKDAFAGTHKGGIPTFAKPDTSHYKRPDWRNPHVKVTLYDSDALSKPSVFERIIGAAHYQGTKIQTVPPCEGFPKAGLVEYFKSGHNADDYRALVDSAMSLAEFISWVPEHLAKNDPKTHNEFIGKLIKAIVETQQSNAVIESCMSACKTHMGLPYTQFKSRLAYQRELAFDAKRADDGVSDNDKVDAHGIAEHVLKHVFHPDGDIAQYFTNNGSFFKYSGSGFWEVVPGDQILKMVSKCCAKAWKVTLVKGCPMVSYAYASNYTVEDCYKYVMARLYAPMPREQARYLCFKNGTVDLQSGELLPHDPDHRLTFQVDAEYKPVGQCPTVFKDFITAVYGEDYIEVWRALVGMYLDPSSHYGKAVHIIGSSGSGKGTTIRFLQSCFSENATQQLSGFSEIASPEKRHQNLLGKTLVTLPDVAGYQSELQAFYELVDNGSMSGRALYKAEGYSRKWSVRFLFASVNELKIENGGDGWDRRIMVLRTKPRKGDMVRDLDQRLASVKGEVISWALAMDRQARHNIIEHPEAVAPNIAWDNFLGTFTGDPIKQFIDACFEPEDGGYISNAELFKMYAAYCKAAGYKAQAINGFVTHLKTVMPANFQERKSIGGGQKSPAGFKGLKLVSNAIFTYTEFSNGEKSGEPQCNLEQTVEGSYWQRETRALAHRQSPVATAPAPVKPEITNSLTLEDPMLEQHRLSISTAVSDEMLESAILATAKLTWDQRNIIYQALNRDIQMIWTRLGKDPDFKLRFAAAAKAPTPEPRDITTDIPFAQAEITF